MTTTDTERELSALINALGTSPDAKEKEEYFQKCKDTVEHERQIATYAEKIEKEIHDMFEVGGMPLSDALQTKTGRELAEAVGPKIMMSHRDAYFVPALADLIMTDFTTPTYYIRSKDVALAVVSASTTDGGSAQATNPLITMKGYDTPVDVIHRRLIMTYQYDNPKLAMSKASSRTKALDTARYRTMKAYQDVVIAAWTGSQYTSASPFPTAIYHELPTGRVHPTNNTIDATTGGLSLAKVKEFSKYFSTFGFDGQKLLFVSDLVFEQVKDWASTTTATDTGRVLAEALVGGKVVDTIPVYDVLIVKKNVVPDNKGWGLMLSDQGTKTLGVYQFGQMQSLPSNNSSSTRAAFDMVLPGLAGVCHDAIRTAFVTF